MPRRILIALTIMLPALAGPMLFATEEDSACADALSEGEPEARIALEISVASPELAVLGYLNSLQPEKGPKSLDEALEGLRNVQKIVIQKKKLDAKFGNPPFDWPEAEALIAKIYSQHLHQYILATIKTEANLHLEAGNFDKAHEAIIEGIDLFKSIPDAKKAMHYMLIESYSAQSKKLHQALHDLEAEKDVEVDGEDFIKKRELALRSFYQDIISGRLIADNEELSTIWAADIQRLPLDMKAAADSKAPEPDNLRDDQLKVQVSMTKLEIEVDELHEVEDFLVKIKFIESLAVVALGQAFLTEAHHWASKLTAKALGLALDKSIESASMIFSMKEHPKPGSQIHKTLRAITDHFVHASVNGPLLVVDALTLMDKYLVMSHFLTEIELASPNE